MPSTDSSFAEQNSRPISSSSTSYDYIFVGAGCAGLSLLMRMLQSGAFHHKKILLLDRSPKKANDKTWCFWDAGNIEAFWKEADIVHHQWNNLWLKHPAGNLLLDIVPFSYKMIRSEDFYRHCFSIINNASNVEVRYAEVTDTDAEKGIITTLEGQFSAPVVFSSVLLDLPQLKPKELYLLQHFRGWWVETNYDAFDPAQADLMNFRTPQTHGCAFVYVLPVSKRRALIEYTLFTEETLTDEAYDTGLKDFIRQELKLIDYKVAEVEKGIIPMTDYYFAPQQGKVFFIGTAGGQTKASTGYTFSFIQKQSEAITKSMLRNGMPAVYPQPYRFQFYDSVLLRVLHERKLLGADVFYNMFKKNKATSILRFLDNESHLGEELLIMNSTQKKIFIPAAMKTFRK